MHFAENAQLICVDGRPESIEMHAFSNETKTALVLKGAVSQPSSGYMVFRPKSLAKFLSTERQPLKLAVSSIERARTSKLVVASPRRCLHPDIMPLPRPPPPHSPPHATTEIPATRASNRYKLDVYHLSLAFY